ncbi:MAG: cobalamin-dependent protein [Bacillota bacterium]
MRDVLRSLKEGVVQGDQERVLKAARTAVERRLDLPLMASQGLGAGMEDVGKRWNRGEMFLPEVMLSAQIFKEAMAILEPAIRAGGKTVGALGDFVIGTVSGDLHDLGKNLVAVMLETTGFRVHDLGRDVSAEDFVNALKNLGGGILGMSALLTTTMIEQKNVIHAIIETGLRAKTRIMVGGAPVSIAWAEEIGADAYAANAHQAVSIAKGLARDMRGGVPR